MSSDRAFYVSNLIEQAVAHVLYVCPRLTTLDVDPIVILVFSGGCSASWRLPITQSISQLHQ